MKRQTLNQYDPPSYPAREDGESAVHELLPDRWRRNSTVAGAVALLFFPLGGGCTAHAAESANVVTVADDKKNKEKPAPKLTTVFEHGEGRGAFGCVAVAPPAFLTEADARQIILEEFAKVGVKFQLDRKSHPTIRERSTEVSYVETDGGHKRERRTVHGEKLLLDGYDPKHKIGFEYVSTEDAHLVDGYTSYGSAGSYHLKDAAQALAREAEKDDSMNVAFFYDPMSGNRRRGNESGEDDLRSQVRDFIQWLRDHDILEKP